MKLSKARQKTTLALLVALIVIINGYNYLTGEKPHTAPLTYTRGAVAPSSVRQGISMRTGKADPLDVFLARRGQKYPGVVRDIFKMENPVPKTRMKLPPPPVVTAPTPSVPEKTPEQIAEESARAELSRFRFLGYLTEKDNTIFLSKDGELFMVKSGGLIQKTYKIKEAGKDSVVLMDTSTPAEVRVELSGSEQAPPAVPQRSQQPQTTPPTLPQRSQQPLITPQQTLEQRQQIIQQRLQTNQQRPRILPQQVPQTSQEPHEQQEFQESEEQQQKPAQKPAQKPVKKSAFPDW